MKTKKKKKALKEMGDFESCPKCGSGFGWFGPSMFKDKTVSFCFMCADCGYKEKIKNPVKKVKKYSF